MKQISPTKNKIVYLILVINCILLTFLPSGHAGSDNRSRPKEISFQKTVSLYQRNDCLTSVQVEYGKEIIKGLDYNAQRILRFFSREYTPAFSEYQTIWSILITFPLRYEQVVSFEEWSRLPGVNQELAIQAIQDIATLSYHAGLSFQQLAKLPDTTASFLLAAIPLLNGFKDPVNQCVQNACSIKGITAKKITSSLDLFSRLSTNQALAAQSYALLDGITPELYFESLFHIGRLARYDAWNFYTLIQEQEMKKELAWEYLVGFFAHPLFLQEQQYPLLSNWKKEQLLNAMYSGGDLIIRRINNLHAITDRFGAEIPANILKKLSIAELEKRFNQLSHDVRQKFAPAVTKAKKDKSKLKLITTLGLATREERMYTAENLTSANIYALMARGGELFTSSFREILVPTFHIHLQKEYNGNLLQFLNNTDPDNILTSQFITNCSLKGVLHSFLPKEPEIQKQILQALSKSAFKNEQTILIFSASLIQLCKALSPESRNYLVELMLAVVKTRNAMPAKLTQMMLQYLLRHNRQLLNPGSIKRIELAGIKSLPPNLSTQDQAPFYEWLSDNTLSSLSLFYPDDDGRQSFISYAVLLRKKGYLPIEATGYNQHLLKPQQTKQLQILKDGASYKQLSKLFSFMEKERGCITYSKRINGVTIQHTLSVYSSANSQQALLEKFISSNDEMLSQRGHSYWRADQLIAPLEKLSKNGYFDMPGRKPRLLNIGSCGGLMVYTDLFTLLKNSVEIFTAIGTGFTHVNNQYTIRVLELIAQKVSNQSWRNIARDINPILPNHLEYIQPGSLTALLHKEYLNNQL